MKKSPFARIKQLLPLVLIICTISQINATTVVFDAGGVLVQTKKSEIVKKMIGKFISYALFSWKNPAHIKTLTFTVMEELYGKQVPEEGCPCACGDGIILPALMCTWLSSSISSDEIAEITGKKIGEPITGKEIIECTCKCIDDGSCNNLLHDRREKELVKSILCIMFDPEMHANFTHPIPEGVKLLEECAKKEKNCIMLLSNYAADAFEQIYNKQEMQDAIFRFIRPEYLVVSGFLGMIKPYKSIFNHLVSGYNLDPATIVFIDDQEENIQMAKQCGWKTVHLKDNNYKAARAELKLLGVL